MRRVFIVEGEGLLAMELMHSLRSMDCEVCGHARSAEAALREIPDARPDLILMDVNLGPGMDGLEVIERLRPGLDAEVIFLVDAPDAKLAERALELGSCAYLDRPYDAGALAAKLELAFARHEPATSLEASEARQPSPVEEARSSELSARSSAARAPARARARAGTGHVLLVDDEELVLTVTARIIERIGYSVTALADAQDALAVLRRDPQRISVVVTDRNMPEMSGLELADAIAEIRSDLPTVLVSGNLADDEPRFNEHEGRFLLSKPFKANDLAEVLARAFAAAPATAP